VIGARTGRFHADWTDPLAPLPSKDTDNSVERWLFSDFRRIGSRWSIARSAEPLRASGATLFPDVTFESGMDRVPVEIIGFHTAAYLQNKLDSLARAGLTSVVLAVDDLLACSERRAAAAPNVVHFQKRIEMAPLLCTIERVAAMGDAPPDSDQPSSEC
jgi:predicted nuclease of restriction endonuclease-like RecB superfamily